MNKNLRDFKSNSDIVLKDTPNSISYMKTDKLVTALYMVTDIIDREEPIRNKLRTLGIKIISDINDVALVRSVLVGRLNEIMSFLDIASAMNFISEMNCTILKKEFLELKASIQGVTQVKPIWLEEFFKTSSEEERGINSPPERLESSSRAGKGHTRIGVQKGSTLMQALSDKTVFMSDKNHPTFNKSNFDILKKQRRDNIVNIIKIIGGNATIKDIKDKVQTIPEKAGLLVSCSEKTLQRELMSMIKDGVLNKTGEKRWSRYFIK